MIPSARCAKSNKFISESLSHLNDSSRHNFDLFPPSFKKFRSAENQCNNLSTMFWRVGVHRTNNSLDVRAQSRSRLCRRAYNMHTTCSFSVKSKVLSVGLSNYHLEALSNEVSDSLRISFEISSSKSLICRIEEWEMVSLSDNTCDCFPLFKSWVNTSWIVCASMEEDYRALWSFLEVIEHSLEVKSSCLTIPVSIGCSFETCLSSNSVLISPGWLRSVDYSLSWEELSQKLETNS
mmetsp:Transcript_3057/g.4555  ORF Transcript_3057/g.4555 Transcript_3057/m.4555 type:complete len:236 (+) Transcript_3057:354-1061(+)